MLDNINNIKSEHLTHILSHHKRNNELKCIPIISKEEKKTKTSNYQKINNLSHLPIRLLNQPNIQNCTLLNLLQHSHIHNVISIKDVE